MYLFICKSHVACRWCRCRVGGFGSDYIGASLSFPFIILAHLGSTFCLGHHDNSLSLHSDQVGSAYSRSKGVPGTAVPLS